MSERTIDAGKLAAAQRLHAQGHLTEGAYLAWCMAEVGITHRDIALLRRRSKGTITEQITRARRLVDNELTRTKETA